jgi:hypothetical protein
MVEGFSLPPAIASFLLRLWAMEGQLLTTARNLKPSKQTLKGNTDS